MRAVAEGDLVAGMGKGAVAGIELSEELRALPVKRLRILEGVAVDAADYDQFWIDGLGQKHIVQIEKDWQSLACGWDDELVNSGGTWRVRDADDRVAQAKVRARAILAFRAEQARQKYITPGDGKAAVYSLKREEVLRYQAVSGSNKPISKTDYPWMNARATRLGVELQVVALEWAEKVAHWESVGRAIENAVEAAVDAVDALADAATIEADITTIVEGIRWP